MKEYELDNWFFDLPACLMKEITGIPFNEDNATDNDYEDFENAAAMWWDCLDYEDKLSIYEKETA